MSMHTYIGARYVPNFTGTYDPTQSYEAMDVVDNGSGTSYIAKVPTPAGTPLTDTDHWFLYGSTSGAIVQLQNDMIQAQNDIGALQGDMTQAQNDITALHNEIVNPARTFAVVTDSYGVLPAASNGFLDYFESRCTANGYGFYGIGGGNAGFYHQGADGNFLDLFQTLEASFADPDAITDIIFAGGVNDHGDAITDVRIAYQALYTYIRTNYPNAKVQCAFVSYAVILNNNDTDLNDYLTCIATMEQMCGYFKNWRKINGMEYIMHAYNLMSSDLVHPNAGGAKYIGEALYQAAKEYGDHDFILTCPITFTLYSGTAVNGFLEIHNDIFTITCPDISSTNAMSIPASGWVSIGTWTPNYVLNARRRFIADVVCTSDDNLIFNGQVSIDSTYIRFRSFGTGSRAFTNPEIKAFTIIGQTLLV